MAKLNKKKINKSNVKLAGLKSSFFSNESILLTSFGRGEQAILEKKLLQEKLDFEKSPKKFQVQVDQSKIHIIGTKNETGQIFNPLNTKPSKRFQKKLRKLKAQNIFPIQQYSHDLINAKKELEVMFYNKEFKDNIHIQIIYNLLDIQKIISPFINDLIFSLDSLLRDKNQNHALRDFVGNMTSTKFEVLQQKANDKFDNFQLYLKEAKPLLPYFGEAFEIFNLKKQDFSNKTAKGTIHYPSDNEIYNIFRSLSFIRHSIFHFKLEEKESIFRNQNYPLEIKQTIDRIFDKKILLVNNAFFENNSKANFKILFKLFNIQDSKSQDALNLAQKLYTFTIRKDQLNLGVSIRKLREEILLLESAKEIKSKEFDSVRSKLYLFMDFLISEEYYKNNNHLLTIINSLRAAKNDEEKELYYQNEANRVWSLIENKVRYELVPIIKNPKEFKLFKMNVDREMFKSKLITNQVSSFSKLMYLFSSFLDGKESNDLLTGLIHKLLEISSMQEFLNSSANADFERTPLQPMVSVFNNSKQLANELMLVKSLVHRSYDPVFTKQTLLEAAQIIGFKNKPQNLSDLEYLDKVFDEHKNTNFKNFLINNVIASRRFIYVVRYVSPQIAKKMVRHKPSIMFVLKRISSEQIDKYYSSVFLKTPSNVNFDEKINQLAEKLISIYFEDFLNVVQGRPKGSLGAKPTPEENKDKENKKAILGLYLTVIYHFFKGLIRVNSRYTIGFYTFERDNAIKVNNREIFKAKENPPTPELYLTLLNHFIERKRFKSRVNDYLVQNKTLFDPHLFLFYRNNVAHLEVLNQSDQYFTLNRIPSSYFEIYHTIMGIILKNNSNFLSFSNYSLEKLNSILQFNVYSKDLLHILNLPFAYNLPRYKNLSIEILFDQNENIEQAKK